MIKQKKPLAYKVRTVHRLLGLIVGLQLLLWISGGVFMSITPFDWVKGKPHVMEKAPYALPSDIKLAPIALLQRHDLGAIQSIQLKRLLSQRWVYLVKSEKAMYLFDAQDAKLLSPINEQEILKIALADYQGDGNVSDAMLLTDIPLEMRGRSAPLWSVTFDDTVSTTLYISGQSGDLVGRRNTTWRIYDFFWMLHIMDYSQRDDFNNLLLMASAVSALLFVISGFFMLFFIYRRKFKSAK